MRRLTALPSGPTTYLDWYVSIRDRKRTNTRGPLVTAHALIAERYGSLAEAIGNGSLASLESDTRALHLSGPLRACYDGSTEPLRQLKQAIKEAQPRRQLKYCPMCGTTLPKTFDHYMPAVRFPEFAVHALNLVPCCSTCNSTKDDDWLSVTGRRQFLHAYTDEIPDLQFVRVTLHENQVFEGVGATFSLERPEGMADEQWSLIDSHFRRLKLIDRYNELSNDEISEVLSDCRVFYEAGGGRQNVRNFLVGRANERRNVHGINHWIVVLMNAMALHADLEVWVCSERAGASGQCGYIEAD